MKKIILIASLFLCSFSFAVNAQIKATASGNVLTEVVTPVTLESLIKTAEITSYTFKTSSGDELPVYKSINGKLFVCRMSKKSGNYYKQYITIEG